MKAWKKRGTSMRLVQLSVAASLLLTAASANAADYTQCMQTYQKSLGIPGTKTCAIGGCHVTHVRGRATRSAA